MEARIVFELHIADDLRRDVAGCFVVVVLFIPAHDEPLLDCVLRILHGCLVAIFC